MRPEKRGLPVLRRFNKEPPCIRGQAQRTPHRLARRIAATRKRQPGFHAGRNRGATSGFPR
jgi:hypothetical protein